VPIEEVVRERLPEGPLSEGISVAGVEFQRILDDIRKASDGLEAGALEETVVVLDRMSLVFRPVDPETFLVVVLDPNGNLGKARYLIRSSLYAIRQEL
jgi:predicted regulator of Ras-like GTPase activity (Roadblock/LC7/MglB family)